MRLLLAERIYKRFCGICQGKFNIYYEKVLKVNYLQHNCAKNLIYELFVRYVRQNCGTFFFFVCIPNSHNIFRGLGSVGTKNMGMAAY